MFLSHFILHKSYDWFKDLNLRWYAVPAVSSMLFDCGGIQFTGCAFSGWYVRKALLAGYVNNHVQYLHIT